jgi:hypothetical protein
MTLTSSTSRRRRLRLSIAGLVFAVLATLVPVTSAAAATTGRVTITNNCGSSAKFAIYSPWTGYMTAGGVMSAGASHTYYLTTGRAWRIELPRGTTRITPTTYYTYSIVMC